MWCQFLPRVQQLSEKVKNALNIKDDDFSSVECKWRTDARFAMIDTGTSLKQHLIWYEL